MQQFAPSCELTGTEEVGKWVSAAKEISEDIEGISEVMMEVWQAGMCSTHIKLSTRCRTSRSVLTISVIVVSLLLC